MSLDHSTLISILYYHYEGNCEGLKIVLEKENDFKEFYGTIYFDYWFYNAINRNEGCISNEEYNARDFENIIYLSTTLLKINRNYSVYDVQYLIVLYASTNDQKYKEKLIEISERKVNATERAIENSETLLQYIKYFDTLYEKIK